MSGKSHERVPRAEGEPISCTLSRRMRRRIVALAAPACVLVATAAIGTSPAIADGQAIASATPVVYGQQEFGNTANGGVGDSRCVSSGNAYRSWWGLSVTSGDQLAIDWETHEKSMTLFAFPVGTTDFTFLTISALLEKQVNINYKEQATYTATQTGVIPIEFKSDTGCNNPTAPYNFTATVLHAVVLSLPTVTALPDSGAISVAVHNPDGAPLSDPNLVVSFEVLVSGSSYTAVGSAPVVNGTATVPFTLPSSTFGQSVTIEASSTGAVYVPGSSATEAVTVAKPAPPPPPCVVPTMRRGQSLRSVEAAIRRAHCAVGRIVRIRTRRYRRGAALSISPRSGSQLPNGTPVAIVASRGRH